MKQGSRVYIGAVAVLICCMVASVEMSKRIAASAGRHQLIYTDTVGAEGDSPEAALGVALGAFRGLFVNYLWMRATSLQEDGKYYEAIDLAETITKLQPRFPRVWAFHAWNLSYNISVATHTPLERWQWVQAGIKLLRDEGIPKNPNSLLLYKELAWIFKHKVGGHADDASSFYKQQFAKEWHILLGPPPERTAELRRTEDFTLKVQAQLQRIIDAPNTLEALYAEFPKTEDAPEGLAKELVDDLLEGGIELNMDLLERFARDSSTINANSRLGLSLNPQAIANDPFLRALLNPKYNVTNADGRVPGSLLLDHVRKRMLVDEYHMNPTHMLRYVERYGPMDWRLPAAHSVYWGTLGVEMTLDRVTDATKRDFDFANTDRSVLQALQDLWRHGQIYFDINNPGSYRSMPSPDFIQAYGNAYDDLVSRSRTDSNNSIYSMAAAGYENFMRDVIRYLFRRGQKEQAEQWYAKLRTWNKLNRNAQNQRMEQTTVSLEEFVVNEIQMDQRQSSPDVAKAEIYGSLEGAYFNGLMNGDQELFESSMKYARSFHQIYMDQQSFRTTVNYQGGTSGRMEVMDPDFDAMAAQIMVDSILSISSGRVGGDEPGALMYQRAPIELQARVYGLLRDRGIKAELDNVARNKQGLPFDTYFPPPEGVEEYLRAIEARRAAKEAQQGPETGQINLQ